MRKAILFCLFLAVVVCSFSVPAAQADPLFLTNMNNNIVSGSTAVQQDFHSLVPNGVPNASGFLSLDGSAIAGPGGLQVSNQAQVSVIGNNLLGFSGVSIGGLSVEARMIFNDIVFAGPGSDPIPVSLNLMLSGTFGTNQTSIVDPANSSTLFCGAGLEIEASLSGGGYLIDTGPLFWTQTNTNGIVASFNSLGGITTPTGNMLLNTPITLDVMMIPSAAASAEYSGGQTANLYASGLSDFSHTLSFPATGPVFNLPAGYTVNSLSGLIVDNQWVTASAVPEPATLFLLVPGLFGLIGLKRNRKHSDKSTKAGAVMILP